MKARDALEAHADAIERFVVNIREQGMQYVAVIVIVNVDDSAITEILAKELHPNFDAQPIRDRGMVPYVRGWVDRATFEPALRRIDPIVAAELHRTVGIPVVIFDDQRVSLAVIQDAPTPIDEEWN